MKLFFAFFLLLSSLQLFAQTAPAEAAPPEAAAPKETSVKYSTVSANKTFYIRDYMYVPLRSGESSAYRIIHKGLKSGTAITLVKQNPKSGYSLIRTKDGTEGWLPTQYLMEDVTAAHKLTSAEKRIRLLETNLGPAGERLLTLEKRNGELETQLSDAQKQLSELQSAHNALKNLSSNAIKMEEAYQQQLVALQNNQIKIDTLTIENGHLKKEVRNNSFLFGAFVLFSGMMITLILQWFFNRRRKRSDWR